VGLTSEENKAVGEGDINTGWITDTTDIMSPLRGSAIKFHPVPTTGVVAYQYIASPGLVASSLKIIDRASRSLLLDALQSHILAVCPSHDRRVNYPNRASYRGNYL
jgi:hypothetical protein